MVPRHGRAAVFAAVVVMSCVLASCSSSPTPRRRTAPSTTTTTTLAATSTTETLPPAPGVAVPNVIGMKITPARFYLRVAGFFTIPMTAPCNKGTLTSQSIVASLSVPGKLPHANVGAVPLVPGTPRPKGSLVGITWSGCYPGGSVVPKITDLSFAVAVNLLHTAGLSWACYSVATTTTTRPPATTTRPPTTTTTRPVTTTAPPSTEPPTSTTSTTMRETSTGATSSVAHVVTSTTLKPPQTVLSQDPAPGSLLTPGTSVTITMHACPQ